MEHKRPRVVAAALAGLGLAVSLSACGGGSIKNADTAGGSSTKECGDLNVAVNPWVGYEADAHVLGYVAKTRLGCNVNYKDLDEQVSWKGFGSGEVDVVVENWGHPELQKKYMSDKGGDGSAVDFGSTGNEGVIGWFVPPWMAEKYPDITDWKNLNKYASLFRTAESGGKGQLMDGSPSYITNDKALVKNLKLDYQVVFAGSEAAQITQIRQSAKKKKPFLTYWYEPQWLFKKVPMTEVKLPPYKKGCDADAAKVACAYPHTPLQKYLNADFARNGGRAARFLKNFRWTTEDQNEVALLIADRKLTPEQAAKKWVDSHPSVWKKWLPN
jgi:glycine betaine/proline transport system substrate-binding protein